MDTVEHRVNCHRMAAERRAAGKNPWAQTVRIKHLFVPRSDAAEVGASVAAILRAAFPSKLDMDRDYDFDLAEMVERFETITGFEGVTPTEEFDATLDEFYTWVDNNRVWVA